METQTESTKKQAPKNEVATKAKHELAVLTPAEQEMMAAFDSSGVEAIDLKIPKILLMQAMSIFVNETHQAESGDLVNSVTAEKYGNVREKDYSPIRVVPIHMFKSWVVQEKLQAKGGKDKLEYNSTVPVTPDNTDWEWDFTDTDNRRYKRTKCLNFYVLLERDLGNPLALPHVLTFRSTSFKEGGNLSSHFALCATAKAAKIFRPSFDRFFEIGGKLDKNDDGAWWVLTAKESVPTPKENHGQLFTWYKQITSNAKTLEEKIDTSEFGEQQAPSTAALAGKKEF